jgi:hypothetical protein
MATSLIEDTSATHTQAQVQFRRVKRWLIPSLLAVVVGIIVGVVWGREWYVEQFNRIGWARASMLMISEAIALFWCVRYLLLHGLLGRPVQTRKVESSALGGPMAVVIGSILLCTLIDGTMSLQLMLSRVDRYEQADRIVGTVVKLDTQRKPRSEYGATTSFDAVVEFQHGDQSHQFRASLSYSEQLRERRVREGIKPMWDYQPGLLEKFQAGQVPFEVRMRVNPDRPAEAWIEHGPLGAPTADFAVLSLAFAFFQICTSFVAVLLLATGPHRSRSGRGSGMVPWYLEPINFIPLAFESLVLALGAIA